MSEIGVGVIGCGNRIRAVINTVLASAYGRIAVRGLFDPFIKSIEQSKELYGDYVTVHQSYDELVESPQVDWVFIGSYNCFHKEHATAALKAGKHVFCEKPLATTMEDCIAMYNAWRESGKKFNIGFTLRYSPHYRKLKELLDAGEIGNIISMEFNETLDFNHGGYIHGDWRRQSRVAGSHMLEKCCHDIDLLNWLVDSRAESIASFGGTNFFTPENENEMIRLGKSSEGHHNFMNWELKEQENPFTAEKDIIDNQVVIFEFANKVRASFHTNCSTTIPERRMYICGTRGTIRADVISGSIEIMKIGFDEKLLKVDAGVCGGHGGGDSVLGQEVADCMLKGYEPMSGFEAGLKSAVTVFGIDKAMTTRSVVDMEPFWEKLN